MMSTPSKLESLPMRLFSSYEWMRLDEGERRRLYTFKRLQRTNGFAVFYTISMMNFSPSTAVSSKL